MTKTCTICMDTKEFFQFSKNNQQKDGYACVCKICKKQIDREYYKKHQDKIKSKRMSLYYNNKNTILEKQKQYRVSNKEEMNKVQRARYSSNKERYKARNAAYIQANKERHLAVRRARRFRLKDKINAQKRANAKNNPYCKISGNLRKRIRTALRSKKQGGIALEYLGCTISELRVHLESQFTKDMDWNNYGPKGWHIEHILGLTMFDLKNSEHLKISCHYTNLRPLHSIENLERSKYLTKEETKELCEKYNIQIGNIVLKYK